MRPTLIAVSSAPAGEGFSELAELSEAVGRKPRETARHKFRQTLRGPLEARASARPGVPNRSKHSETRTPVSEEPLAKH